MSTLREFRSFNTTVRLLLVNQFAINLGFYMLMPYLAQHLAGVIGLAAWAIGLVLGARNFCQQGMFLLGGLLADRWGYKPLIAAGCLLRTAGFAALGVADTLPVLLVASAVTGLAGALFNPAVRAYVAAETGERRVEAFALFNVFYQAGILLGPAVGFALLWSSFRLACLVAAGIFALLALVQLRALPTHRTADSSATTDEPAGGSLRSQWRTVAGNRGFLLFALTMTASYVLSYQVYLALPLELRRILGDGQRATVAVVALFGVSGLLPLLAQTRLTAWCRRTRSPAATMRLGLIALGAAFLPPLVATAIGPSTSADLWAVVAILAAAGLLALGTMLTFPFEMDTIVRIADQRLVATHYGLYNTICGVGITVGNLATGAMLDTARAAGLAALPWAVLAVLAFLAAGALHRLDRTGRLRPTSSTVAVG